MKDSRARDPRAAAGPSWPRRAPIAAAALAALGTILPLTACGDSLDAASGDGSGGGANGAPDDVVSATSGGTSGVGGAPPEEELESSFTAPVATGRFVWVANPESGRIAYIDATTLAVKVVEAGHQPTHLAAVPAEDQDVALVLNVASRDATLLRADPDGGLDARTFEVPSGGNRWTISGDGRWAIAWTDARLIDAADPIDGFQDVALLDLASEDERSIPLTVGYRPVAVAFDEDGHRAFAVTQDGITVIDLEDDEPQVEENVALSEDPLEDTLTRDVAITPDGALALVRRDGEAFVTVHDLDDGSRSDVALPGAATDMDLTADGSAAVVVIRETGQVAVLPVPEIASEPGSFALFSVTATVVGSASLAEESSTGFLYTNAVPSPVITVFDWAQVAPEPRPILLRAPVAAVFPTRDGAHTLVLHDAFEVEGGTRYPGAISLVPVEAELPPKIVGLDAPVIAVAMAPSGDRTLVAVGDRALARYGFVVASFPSLKVDAFDLGSMPIAAGVVAGAGRGFVAQEHPDGRITFVDFSSSEVRTLTGFELASQVVDGGVP